jgi:hypothetical protein
MHASLELAHMILDIYVKQSLSYILLDIFIIWALKFALENIKKVDRTEN